MVAKTTGLASIAEGRSDLHMVSPYKLVVRDGWNTREQTEELIAHIDSLAQSIAEVGVKEPLTVFWEDGKAYVTDGHCRLAASIRAIEHYKSELKTIPVKSEGRYSSEADRVLSQLVRNQGKPLTPFEKGKVFKRLIDLGWQQNDIAKKVGLSPARVSQCLELQTLPAELKDLVVQGKVSASMALDMLKEADGNVKAVLARLNGAVIVAASEGRKRALPRDTGEHKKNAVTLVKDVFERCEFDDSGDKYVIITMHMADWNAIVKTLKL
jgi:ParB family transcriptional regulator, chromosome partitioning protein